MEYFCHPGLRRAGRAFSFRQPYLMMGGPILDAVLGGKDGTKILPQLESPNSRFAFSL